MIEVEVKLPVADVDAVIRCLEAQGYVKEIELHEEDVYFNGPDHDLKKNDEALRVRVQEVFWPEDKRRTNGFVTYKGKKLDQVSMAREELETAVQDAKVAHRIFVSLGYIPMKPVVKDRRLFRLGELSVCVDHVQGLGDYLELEICVPDDAKRPWALQLIEEELKCLGYSMADTTRISYLSMIEMLEDNEA